MTEFYEQVKERLMRYARINTESDPHSTSVPTTSCQHDLASVIYEELQKIGATNVYYDKDTCVVYGSLEANVKTGRAIGFVTHMDTAPDASGKDVKPWVLENYDGNDIVLNKEKDIVMSPSVKIKSCPIYCFRFGNTLGDITISFSAFKTMSFPS